MSKEITIPTFEEWWKNQGSQYFNENAKEVARYTWNYCWNKARTSIEKAL